MSAHENSLYEQLRRHCSGVFFTYTLDKAAKILQISEGCLELFGYDARELTGAEAVSYETIIYLEDRKWLREKKNEQIENGLPIINEYRIICGQGKIKWVKEIATVHQGQENAQAIVEAFVQDITPYKSNAFMSNAFTSYQNAVNSGSIVSIADRNGKYLFVNELFCKLSGYSRMELIGKDYRMIDSDLHDPLFYARMTRTLLSGQIWRGQIKGFGRHGNTYWLDTVVSPIMDDKGQVEQFLSISNNITEQKEGEYALIESEALNRTIIKSLDINIAIIDESGWVEKVNDNWLNNIKQLSQPILCNVGTGENLFRHLEILREQGDLYANHMKTAIVNVMTNEKDFAELEYPCQSVNGERWYFAHVSKFENDLKRIIISNFDITERKMQEESLRKNEARLNEAQRIAQVGSWEHDINSNQLTGSPEIFAIFGLPFSNEPSSYDVFMQLVHPQDREMIDQAYKESLARRVPYNVVHRIICPDGKIKYVREQCETMFDDSGQPIRSFGTTQDVTEEKQFELSLENERQRYQNVVENISDALIIDDIQGRITFANGRFMEMIGLNNEDIADFDFIEHVVPEHRKAIIERHNKRMRGEEADIIFEYAGFRKNGERRWFEARVTKIIENGEIKGTQSAIRDITEAKESLDLLKASESEKTRLLNELTKRYNELMQFNYIVSHNLRAPIANLMGLSEIFTMPSLDEEEKGKIIDHIQVSIQKIDELIQDLNIILAARSDINSKKELIEFEPTISSIKHTLEKQIVDSNTHIRTSIAENAGTVFSIKSYVKSILYNLINNAIKYKSPDRHPEIMITITRSNQNILIRIADNGIGIDLEKYGKEVFGLYKRFNLDVEGKGLGLNMTKTQVEALGGNIEISSTPGKGTTFYISIPDTIL